MVISLAQNLRIQNQSIYMKRVILLFLFYLTTAFEKENKNAEDPFLNVLNRDKHGAMNQSL